MSCVNKIASQANNHAQNKGSLPNQTADRIDSREPSSVASFLNGDGIKT
jgi:hypothetical protein